MTSEKHRVEWFDRRREPQCAPDPAYPNGIDVDSGERPACRVELRPYPTPRCGYFFVTCEVCKTSAAITTAGRPDDPRSIMLPCKAIQ